MSLLETVPADTGVRLPGRDSCPRKGVVELTPEETKELTNHCRRKSGTQAAESALNNVLSSQEANACMVFTTPKLGHRCCPTAF